MRVAPPTQKLYTIQITGCNSCPGIWYAKKMGKKFANVTLTKWQGVPAYKISSCMFVYTNDCQVTREQTTFIYQPSFK